jgi:hypothetical protein
VNVRIWPCGAAGSFQSRRRGRQEALERLANGESQADVARAYNVDPAAICRLAASGAMPENL